MADDGGVLAALLAPLIQPFFPSFGTDRGRVERESRAVRRSRRRLEAAAAEREAERQQKPDPS